MYSSRGSGAYGQQPYAAGQQGYGQNSTSASILGGSQDAESIGGYRVPGAQYGGQYGSVYGSSTLSSVQPTGSLSGKVGGSSALQGRGGYASTVPESANFVSGDYSSLERRNYTDHQNAYIGRELQSESARRYADSVGLGSQHQSELYDRIDQASLLRQQHILKSQALQSASLDGSARPADYLAARSAGMRQTAQDLTSYGGRMDADSRTLSMLGGSYGQQGSILGAAPRRDVEDLMYAQGSATAGYGVSLPPGRDYAAGKGLRGASIENDYPSSLLSRSRIDERKDDRGSLRRDIEIRDEIRDEERRRRDREKDREREKERERERERKRDRERRDRERERDRKRGPDIRREPTPPRPTRDLPRSSLLREERSLRRDSPRHEALHRRHSPVREKRRDYICKVYPFSLVEVERDYQSISKRYPNLSISPEFSKAVLYWPNGNLKLSIHTPVSFEHGVVELESSAEQTKPSSDSLAEELGQTKPGSIVWNAKVILMSGISKNALDDLSSDKSFDDRIPHINNILRFAFLRKDRSFSAIGGPWDVVDGADPSVDDSSLVQTALRHAKDLVHVNLQNCQQWNRFLEIHYDRVGKDGLFSHKEITVLFIPDLSECLPSLSAWRDQWLAHRKTEIEKDRLFSLKAEKSKEKDAVKKGEKSNTKSDKGVESSKNVKVDGKHVKKEKEPQDKLSDHPSDKTTAVEGGSENHDNEAEQAKAKYEVEPSVKKKLVEKMDIDHVPDVPEVQKSGKKKIVKKVLKQKVVEKAGGENSSSKGTDKSDEKVVGDKQGQEVGVQQDEASVEPLSAKTVVRKKLIKKIPVGKSAKKENKGANTDDLIPEGTPEKVQEDKLKDKIDSESAVVAEGGVKTTTKKKVIKRVPKKKATDVEAKITIPDSVKDENGGEAEISKKSTGDTGKPVLEAKKTENKESPKTESKVTKVEKQDDANKSEKKSKDGKGKEGKGTTDKMVPGTKKETGAAKGKGTNKDSHDDRKEKTTEEKDKKDKTSKDSREKAKTEEPPHHPGFILQTKRSKESKARSMSLSLDSLLDYNDKDIEESTFELSLFAESMYEMLQYQMGCRLLTFLQKFRLEFLKKRNLRKRQREENPKESEKEISSRKRHQSDKESNKDKEAPKSELTDTANKGQEEQNVGKEEPLADEVDDSKVDDESDDYEPEEDADEDQEMDEEDADEDQEMDEEVTGNENDAYEEAKEEDNVTGTEAKLEKEMTEEKDEPKTEGNSTVKDAKDKATEVETKEKTKPAVKELTVDKELLQAFRFFDRNRVGYIKVEDMRFILHNLGKFLSHRDVKELAQSALLESNTARDNRILYKKLVRT